MSYTTALKSKSLHPNCPLWVIGANVPDGPLVKLQTQPRALLDHDLDVEKRLQAEVLKDRIRIQEFFYDFDRLRKGHVGEAGFRTALGTLKFQFSENEMQQLIQKYKLDNGLINY